MTTCDQDATPTAPSASQTSHPAEDQLTRIRAVTDAALAHLDLDELLEELLVRVRDALGADTAAVLLLDPHGRELVAHAAAGLEEEVRQQVRIPLGRGFAGRIAAERKPVVLDHVDHTRVLNPILLEKGVRSLLGVPLMVAGDVLGVLHVGTLRPRRFTDDDAHLLQVVADRVALAIDVRRTSQERAAAKVLQQSIAPGALGTVRGLDIATRYLPGERGAVGGDWFDVFDLPEGRTGVAIGDVVGRGLRAAVVMHRFRSALRAYALDAHDPASVLARLDRMVQHFEPDEMATAVYGVVSRERDEMTLSVAGHPWPLLATPGVGNRDVEVRPDPPIGAGLGPRRNARVDLTPGSVVYLYTDGVVERRGEPIDRGIARLRALDLAGSPEQGCSRIVAALLGDDDPADDFAVLAFRAA